MKNSHFEHFQYSEEEKSSERVHEIAEDVDLADLVRLRETSTEKDEFLIHETAERLSATTAEFGASVSRAYLYERTLILAPGSIQKHTRGKYKYGLFDSRARMTGVERRASSIGFTMTLAHEWLHLMARTQAGTSSSPEWLEEAIVSGLEERLFLLIRNKPPWSNEAKKTELIKELLTTLLDDAGVSKENAERLQIDNLRAIPEKQADLVLQVLQAGGNAKYRAGHVLGYLSRLDEANELVWRGRRIERDRFQDMANHLTQTEPERFPTSEQVFRVFAEAYLRGELSHLIKKSRQWGEE